MKGKKIIALVVAVVMTLALCFALTACGAPESLGVVMLGRQDGRREAPLLQHPRPLAAVQPLRRKGLRVLGAVAPFPVRECIHAKVEKSGLAPAVPFHMPLIGHGPKGHQPQILPFRHSDPSFFCHYTPGKGPRQPMSRHPARPPAHAGEKFTIPWLHYLRKCDIMVGNCYMNSRTRRTPS